MESKIVNILETVLREIDEIKQKLNQVQNQLEDQQSVEKAFGALHRHFAKKSKSQNGIPENNEKTETQNGILHEEIENEQKTVLETPQQKEEIENIIDLALIESRKITFDDLKSSLKHELVHETHFPSTRFKVLVKINGRVYFGEGGTLEKAKDSATRLFLQTLDYNYFKHTVKVSSTVLMNEEFANVNIDAQLIENYQNCLEYVDSMLKYTLVEKTGPDHKPTFKMAAKVNEKTYFGLGGSKAKARMNVVEQVLENLKNQLNEHKSKLEDEPENIWIDVISLKNKQIVPNYLKPLLKYKLVQDAPNNYQMAVKVNEKIYYGQGESKTKARHNVTEKVLRFLLDQSHCPKPSFLLNKLHPNATYRCTQLKNGSQLEFKVTITIGKSLFVGIGPSKKSAKKVAALSALSGIQNCSKSLGNVSKPDIFRKLIEDKICSLLDDKPENSNYKVIAGIVMTRNETFLDVVAVSAGTKCISRAKITKNGVNLNDMHAEILSRRCLIGYFYNQLELSVASKDSIFVPSGQKFKLKDGIEFHLYINIAPCGDARIFCPQTTSKRVLRLKVEARGGTYSIKNEFLRNNFILMSCSDKICRWNVVGLQGALLSQFLDPVYLKSIVLGNVIHESHLQRAVYGRVKDTLPKLPSSFRLNLPSLFFLPSTDPRFTSGPSFAITWSKDEQNCEIINARTGQTDFGPSKYSKREFFKRYVHLCRKIPGQRKGNVYKEAKSASLDYNVAKNCLNTAFEKAGLGNWITHSMEHDMFALN
ncbi:double-stranded RNA-specific editase Adar isoform X1 [Tribolium castaneum]|uniref:double-stranded RNA-specific editase Adar isoform X1 n=1 Tax=Tribolium castaneum TaxID=7070 RepID=UPI0030FEC3A5